MANAKDPIAKFIVDDVHDNVGVELWHTTDGQAYFSMKTGLDNHFEHHLLRDKWIKQWIAARYYTQTRNVVGSSVLSNVINVLEGFAQEGPTYEVYIRIAGANGAIYIDLGNKAWEAVKLRRRTHAQQAAGHPRRRRMKMEPGRADPSLS